MKRLHLIKKKEVWVITLKGWLVIGVTCMIILGCFVQFVHPFLAVTDPKRGQILVVEGWLPCSDFKDYATLGAAVLQDLKVDASRIVSVPAPDVKKDRTYVSALTLKKWFYQDRQQPASLDIITLGPHARRSRILYQMALGADVSVG